MGRNGKFSRRNNRQAKRVAKKQASAAAEPTLWERPPKEEWDPPSELSFALSPKSRLFVRSNSHRGKCIDFAICHQVGGPYRWEDLFRIDSTHDTVHSHDFTKGKEVRTTIESITSPNTVEDQYTEQYDFMLATWEQREKEWINAHVSKR
ncbi:hypothetical protein [Microbacterium sp.]|uniref:hypothetical protein n=1 Tax=Microbacterium sp. TaxID=51671 RepID=UPI003A8D8D44